MLRLSRQDLPWQEISIRLYGRICRVPRQVCFAANTPLTYTYSGQTHTATPLPPWLAALMAQVSDVAGARFNCVLGNLYVDGGDSVAWHSDDEPDMGPVVASLSLGASRAFAMRTMDRARKWTFQLSSGDLFVMGPGVQERYQHTVPKRARCVEPRVNFTFRERI